MAADDVVAKLTIWAVPIEPPEAFQAQVELIRASGAQYNVKEKTWSHALMSDGFSARVLNPLFEAARQYGTHVVAT